MTRLTKNDKNNNKLHTHNLNICRILINSWSYTSYHTANKKKLFSGNFNDTIKRVFVKSLSIEPK